MTLVLRTESHGNIEAGFYASFVQFARLGEYTFATRHICELAEYFATHPQSNEWRVLKYDAEKFWQREWEHRTEFYEAALKKTLQTGQRIISEADVELDPAHRMAEISIEDEIDLHDEGENLIVHIRDKTIHIGMYALNPEQFGYFILYLANGGFIGWSNPPKFSIQTLDAIRSSSHPFYSSIRDYMRFEKE